MAKAKADFAESLLRLQENWESFIKRSETLLMEIALEITQFVLDAPMPEKYAHATERVLAETLERLSGETPIGARMTLRACLDHVVAAEH